jgi:hypothetical protein
MSEVNCKQRHDFFESLNTNYIKKQNKEAI